MFKKIVKKLFRPDRWLYLSWRRAHFGIVSAVFGYFALFVSDGICEVPAETKRGYVYIRPGTTDQAIYDEIFVKKEYDIDVGEPRFIVDAGAHIGLSSVFFATKYPNATIVAIEPDADNYRLLLRNTGKYSNITPMRAGLWHRETHLRIQNPLVDTWSFRVEESGRDRNIPSTTVGKLLRDFHVSRIDILKIDIEGAELEVLTHHASWIDAVDTLIIELHDRFRPGCSEALEAALCNRLYERSQSRESTVVKHLRRA